MNIIGGYYYVGRYSMDNTSAQGQGQVFPGECHGQENLLMKKLNLLFLLASLMVLNGLPCKFSFYNIHH